jgi:tetratricopeptide (TPR) repeat protein
MPRIRPPSLDALHSLFSAGTLAWSADSRANSLTDYNVKQGVFHLLEQERKDEAEQRMLDLRFMAAFSQTWETVVEPLAAWRVVGLERATEGFKELGLGLPPPLEADVAVMAEVTQVADFLSQAGLFSPCLVLRAWNREACGLQYGIQSPESLKATIQFGGTAMRTGDYPMAERILLEAEALSKTLSGEAHRVLRAEMAGTLGGFWLVLGDHAKSRSLYENSLALLLETGATDGPVYTFMHVIQLDLANVIWREGHDQEALERIQSVIADIECEPNSSTTHREWPTWRRLAMAFNLAGAVSDDPTVEHSYYSRGLAIRETKLGLSHPETLVCVHNLANVMARLNDRVSAIEGYQRAYEGRKIMLGALQAETLQSLMCLGQELAEHGDPSGRKLMFEAMTGQEKILGAEHPATLSSLYNIALLLQEEEEEEEQAASLLRRVFEGRSRTLGSAHEDTLLSLWALADCTHEVGDSHECVSLFRRCVAGCREHLGEAHLTTLSVLNNFAHVLAEDPSQQVEAEELYRTVIRHRTRVHGPHSKETLRVRYNLGLLLSKMDRVEETLALWSTVHQLQVTHLAPTDADQNQTASDLCRLAFGTGNERQTLHWVEAHVTGTIRCHGLHSGEAVESLRYSSAVQIYFGQQDAALKTLMQIRDVEVSLHGADDPECIRTLFWMADLLCEMNRPGDAISHRRRCLAILEKTLSPLSTDVIEMAQSLADDHRTAGDTAGAIAIVQHWIALLQQAPQTDKLSEAAHELTEQLGAFQDQLGES